MKKRTIYVLPALLLLLMWLPLSARLGVRWGGDQAKTWVNGSVENFRRHDFDDIGLLPTWDTYPVAGDELDFYVSHPPLIVYVPSFFRALFGPDEMSIRYGFAVATLISGVAVYVLARRLFNQRVALWALLFYSLMPFNAYYGRVVGHEPLGMMVLTLYAAVLVNWLRRPTRGRLAALAFLAILSAWTAWMAVFFIGFLSIVAMLVASRQQCVGIVGIGVVTVLALAALIVFYQVQWDGSIDQLVGKYEYRSSTVRYREGDESFTVLEYLTTLSGQVLFYATPGMVLLAIWGIFTTRKHATKFTWVMLLGLFVGAMSYQLAFRNASFVHAYYKVSLAPVISILAASAFVYVRQNRRIQRWARPVLDGTFIFGFLLVAVIVIVIEHHEASLPWVEDIYTAINTHALPEDIVMTNFRDPANRLTLGFYTGRPIRLDEPFATAQAVADDAMRRVWYVYCESVPYVETVTPQPDIDTSDGLLVSEACWLLEIPPNA